jgi:hypothetical protein
MNRNYLNKKNNSQNNYLAKIPGHDDINPQYLRPRPCHITHRADPSEPPPRLELLVVLPKGSCLWNIMFIYALYGSTKGNVEYIFCFISRQWYHIRQGDTSLKTDYNIFGLRRKSNSVIFNDACLIFLQFLNLYCIYNCHYVENTMHSNMFWCIFSIVNAFSASENPY